jgi:hypothetical protein
LLRPPHFRFLFVASKRGVTHRVLRHESHPDDLDWYLVGGWVIWLVVCVGGGWWMVDGDEIQTTGRGRTDPIIFFVSF